MNPAPDASSGPVTDADVLVLGGTVVAMDARHTVRMLAAAIGPLPQAQS
jgi:hypothetical protein